MLRKDIWHHNQIKVRNHIKHMGGIEEFMNPLKCYVTFTH